MRGKLNERDVYIGDGSGGIADERRRWRDILRM